MTGPATPGQEGPSYGPPQLPEGWIAQWDGHSRKYYFVQLSTGQSTWDTPTQPAPTGPTPQATPQGVDHPHGLPQDAQGGDTDRGLGSFAMNQLLGNKKQSNQSSGVMGLASQFLGGGSSNSNSSHQGSSNSGTSGIVGALAGSLLSGGKKQDHQQANYSGAQTQQGQSGSSGLMGSLGGMFGGHSGSSSGNNYGYSTNNNHQGGYSGTAPPSSYQPSGASSYNASPAQHQQQGQSYSQSQPQTQSYNAAQPSYGTPSNAQQPAYGTPQPSYDAHANAQQPAYGSTPQQPPYGGIQHQASYGAGHPPPQHQDYPPPPNYGGQQHSGNLHQPQHNHFQGMHNAEHSGGLYGNGGQQPPPPPMNSHPNYSGQQRW